MAANSLQRWLLVNYAGYPFAPNSLMPDNGLANLAGALLREKREVQILDFSTVSSIRRFTTPDLAIRMADIWNAQMTQRSGRRSVFSDGRAIVSLFRLSRARARLQRSFAAEIAQSLVDQIRREHIDAVGFKLWNGDGLESSVAMARTVRRACPSVRIFGGGPHVDVFMEQLLDFCDGFDALAYGEGEETIQMLAGSGGDPASYPEIPNLIVRQAGRACVTPLRVVADLDGLPMPAYSPDVYPAMRGDDKIKIIVMDESRGCRNHCAFCIHPVKSSHQLRVKSCGRLLHEIGEHERQAGIRAFRFGGSCTPYSLLNDFSRAVLDSGKQISYASFAHVRESEEADFAAMRNSGCVALFFGVESGSQPILDKMHKGVRAGAIPETLRRARDAGIFTVASLIYPAPGETPATASATIDLLLQEKPGAVTVQAPIVIPRTSWFSTPDAFGIHFPSRPRYIRQSMLCKMNLSLPPAFWQSLPVSIDGRRYKAILSETGRFIRRLEASGITLSVSDDLYLMSRRAHMDALEFRDQMRRAFFAGDVDRIAEAVGCINRGG